MDQIGPGALPTLLTFPLIAKSPLSLVIFPFVLFLGGTIPRRQHLIFSVLMLPFFLSHFFLSFLLHYGTVGTAQLVLMGEGRSVEDECGKGGEESCTLGVSIGGVCGGGW